MIGSNKHGIKDDKNAGFLFYLFAKEVESKNSTIMAGLKGTK